MVFMAEWNGLRTRVIDFGDVRCLVDDIYSIAQEGNEDYRAIDAQARNRISTAVKYLSHTGATRNACRGWTAKTVLSASLRTAKCGPDFRTTARSTSEGVFRFGSKN
jgi:hypothetical protein